MTYRIAVAYSSAELGVLVNDYIKNGWQPHGGVTFAWYGGREKWAQAMVKQL